MDQSPKTDHDWTIHSINIHGIFFERSCQRLISQQPGWEVVDNLTYARKQARLDEHHRETPESPAVKQ